MQTTTRKTVVTEEVPSTQTSNSGGPNVILARLIWFAGAVVIAILLLRFLFILFGANAGNGFVNFIYDISYPLARPFFGIFNYHIHYGLARFEAASLIAIAIYGIAAALLARLLTINRPHTTV